MTLGDRIKKAIDESEVQIPDVAARCGVSVQAVYNWISGKVKDLRNENLFELSDITGFEARWLGTGKGPERTGDRREESLLDLFRHSDEQGKTAIYRVAESLAKPEVKDGDHKDKAA